MVCLFRKGNGEDGESETVADVYQAVGLIMENRLIGHIEVQ